MTNHYADAIDVIAQDLDLLVMRSVCIDYAKRHPKAFVAAAAKAGDKRAVRVARDPQDRCS